MTERDLVTVNFSIDRASLNTYLGNTANATTESGLSEFLAGLFDSMHSYCDRCGSGTSEQTGVRGTFEIVSRETIKNASSAN